MKKRRMTHAHATHDCASPSQATVQPKKKKLTLADLNRMFALFYRKEK
jgi:hypothetical protein